MFVVLSMVCLLIPLLVIQTRFVLRKRDLARQTWDEVLSRVEEVNLAGLKEIADLYLKPDKDQLRIAPNEMWKTVGGLKGLGHLQSNADAMLSLAMFAEQWHSTDGRIVSEYMRRDAARLKKSIARVEVSLLYGFGIVRAPFALQEAIATYILMRGRLLGLYGVAHGGRLPALEAAL